MNATPSQSEASAPRADCVTDSSRLELLGEWLIGDYKRMVHYNAPISARHNICTTIRLSAKNPHFLAGLRVGAQKPSL